MNDHVLKFLFQNEENILPSKFANWANWEPFYTKLLVSGEIFAIKQVSTEFKASYDTCDQDRILNGEWMLTHWVIINFGSIGSVKTKY